MGNLYVSIQKSVNQLLSSLYLFISKSYKGFSDLWSWSISKLRSKMLVVTIYYIYNKSWLHFFIKLQNFLCFALKTQLFWNYRLRIWILYRVIHKGWDFNDNLKVFKGTGRRCMVIKLSMQCCGQIFRIHLRHCILSLILPYIAGLSL